MEVRICVFVLIVIAIKKKKRENGRKREGWRFSIFYIYF
jgi:hypothetical protein